MKPVHFPNRPTRRQGFSLLVTLLMMVLLTIVALGMLSLSSVSLRTAQAQADQAVARANARLGLMLAIGALQKQTGPDQRITMTADQLPKTADGTQTAADPSKSHWTGVYSSWAAGDPSGLRPTPQFLSWLVSAPDAQAVQVDNAKSPVSGASVNLVDKGSLGSTTGQVAAPLVDCQVSGKVAGRLAWWVGDQGVKGPISLPANRTTSTDLATIRGGEQSSSRSAIEFATAGTGQTPFSGIDRNSKQPALVTTWEQGQLLASGSATPKPLFHDLSGHSMGLLTNVRSGGFRKDMSMYLEQALAADMKTTPLYTVNGKNGVNWGELWLYYNFYNSSRGGLQTGGNFTYTTGGTMDSTQPYLQLTGDTTAFQNDPYSFYKSPSFVSMKTIFSLYGKEVSTGSPATTKINPFLVVDPVVVYWNPLDVPLVITPAYNSVKYWRLPYKLNLKRGSGAVDSYDMSTVLAAAGTQYMTFRIGKTKPVVLRPGEILMFSQAPGNNAPTDYSAGRNVLDSDTGFQFKSGMCFALNSAKDPAKYLGTDESFTYDFEASTVDNGYFLTANETYFLNTYASEGPFVALGSGGTIAPSINSTVPIHASDSAYTSFFTKNLTYANTRQLSASQIDGQKQPVMVFAFSNKTEQDSDRPGRFLARYNPKAGSAYKTLQPDELETLPCEVQIDSLTSWKDPKLKLEVSTNGQAYFGGGFRAQSGVQAFTTHSISREPPNSLACFQNAMVNGFTWSSNFLTPGSYMSPQIGHCIGNSMAAAVIPAGQVSAMTTAPDAQGGPQPLADHSYLANQALWDDWFLSSIAPQTSPAFTAKRTLSQVATDFFTQTKPVPNSRYMFTGTDRRETPAVLVSRWFAGGVPSTASKDEVASALAVDGMFNVNSTSVQAWKVFLSGLNNQQVGIRTATGKEDVAATTGIPVISLLAPDSNVAKTTASVDVKDQSQWTGRRVLTADEVDKLAQAIVVEVRKRGPFLSLADFVNRRPGTDKALARSGAIQSALDSPQVPINAAYATGARAATPTAGTNRSYAFVEAENGAAAYGAPGVVKQADILTPIAPYLSARSDTFIVRAYGEAVDGNGKVTARAWCEAELVRGAAFVNTSNPSTTAVSLLSNVNKSFGRRYQIVSFRWLSPSEV